ncbi:hypothetical protein FOA52_016275 [Chlamydomonas sp. UWO 241]|nr:hypothetical protein FOA52_016275 [Chlamydomonas sp. UWO 241]
MRPQVPEEQRWQLLAFVANLVSEDWASVSIDMQTLGFIPPGVDVTEAGLVGPLGDIMSQIVESGSCDVALLTEQLASLGQRYPFTIPPFFGLILRTFSVIEGVGLGVDPQYSIVKACFPYLARRLLADETGRARPILRRLLCGSGARLDAARLARLLDGFGQYTTAGLAGGGAAAAAGAGAAVGVGPAGQEQQEQQQEAALQHAVDQALRQGGGQQRRASAQQQQQQQAGLAPAAAAPGGGGAKALDPMLADALVAMLGRRGTYVQELLVEEAVVAADALSRGALASVVGALLASGPGAVARSTAAVLGPLGTLLLPVRISSVLGGLFMGGKAALGPPSAEDAEALRSLNGLMMLVQRLGATTAAAAAAGAAAGRQQPGSAPADAVTARAQAQGVQVQAPAPGGGGSAHTAHAAHAAAALELGALAHALAPGLAYMGEAFVTRLASRMAARLGHAGAAAAAIGAAAAPRGADGPAPLMQQQQQQPGQPGGMGVGMAAWGGGPRCKF